MITNVEKNASTDNNLIEESHNTVDRFSTYSHAFLEKYGARYTIVYSLINSLSCLKGYCFMRDDTFAKKTKMSISSIKRIIRHLEELGLIYRNTYAYPGGKIRHIVTHERMKTYYDQMVSKGKLPDTAKQRFKEVLLTTSQEVTSYRNSDPLICKGQNDPSYKGHDERSYKDQAGPCNINKLTNNIKNTTTGAREDLSDFKTKLKQELEKAKVSAEKIEHGLDYYQNNQAIVDKKDNPIGFMMWAINSGKASDEWSKRKEQKTTATQNQNNLEKNHKIAENFYNKYRSDPHISLNYDSYSLTVATRRGVTPHHCVVLSYQDPNFINLLSKIRKLP